MDIFSGMYMLTGALYGAVKIMDDVSRNRKIENKVTYVYDTTYNDTSPGSAPGSAPSSSTSKVSINYEPQPSDLAYLLHDKNEEIYVDDTTPIQVKYIVKNLEDYGAKCIPLKVYVSALLRTWETALLLYLPFLYNKEQLEYSQTLILEVSPFLFETDSVVGIKQNSDLPLDFEGNVKEFFNFIKLFIYLNKQGKPFIKGIAEDSLKNIPNNFTIILVAGNIKIHLHIDIQNEKIEYFMPNIQPDKRPINILPKTLQKINNDIVTNISTPSDSNLNNKYESYSDDRLTKSGSPPPPPPPPQTIYSTFQLWGGKSIHFNDFETIAKFGPDIFSFLKWVIEFKSHPKNTPILFVSHSGTMNEFLKMMISNLNYNYTADTSANIFPSQDFVNTCEKSRETNTWSMRFKYLGYNVTGFRHAQSCDNMYKNSGGLPGPFTDRQNYGKYTNLSLWGIFSTLIFIHSNKDIISNFKATDNDNGGLMILSGMDKQPKDNITTFGMQNELTCGDPVSRFSLPIERTISGQPSTASKLTFKPIASVVNTIPPSIPLVEIDIMNITARQRMSNELYSLDNLFKIEFIDCNSGGCKMKVKYIGPYNFSTFISGNDYYHLTPDDKKIIEALVKRSVIINIDKTASEYVLTLQNVNKGGLVFGKDGTQELQDFFSKLTTKDEKTDFKVTSSSFKSFDSDSANKIKISSDFQKSVGFLMGFDLIGANVVTYDIQYNSLILYSNLLIRQLLTTHLLVTTHQPRSNVSFMNQSKDNTKTFLEKCTSNLYGGKNHEKRKKNKKHNKHNNPKK